MASALASLATSSENAHERIQRTSRSSDPDKRFPYFRFSVERDVGDIGLEDWKKAEEMATHTVAYIDEKWLQLPFIRLSFRPANGGGSCRSGVQKRKLPGI
jgi:hypothetical protein